MEFGVEIEGEDEQGHLLTVRAVSEILSEFDGQVSAVSSSCEILYAEFDLGRSEFYFALKNERTKDV